MTFDSRWSVSSNDVQIPFVVPHDWLFPRVAAVVHHGGNIA